MNMRQGWLQTGSIVLAVACVFGGFLPATHAEEPFATELSASEAGESIGDWNVQLKFGERTMEFLLKIVDIDGFTGATIDSQMMPEPQAIEHLAITDENKMEIKYEMSFGSNTMSMTILASLVPDGLEGTIREASGLFESAFTATKAIDDPEASEQRRRNRRGAATSATLRFGREKVRINFNDIKTKSDEFQQDYENLAKVEKGEVFEYVSGRAIKMFTDVDLEFDGTTVKTENAAPGYPGVYSIWLKKTGDGWNFAFNEETDVWGTMYNPEATVAEVPAKLSASDEHQGSFKVELEELANGGRIRILWGDNIWTSDFTVEGFTSKKVAASQ